MQELLLVFALLSGLVGCGSADSEGQTDASASSTATASAVECDPDNGGITLPDGFCAIVFAEEVGRGRHLTVADNGDVYLALSGGGQGIVALRDTTGDGKADVVERFGDHPGGTEIALHEGHLYFGTDESVLRYRKAPGQLVPDAPYETIVSGFPEQRAHRVKTFAFDESGHIYVNVGAPSNACQEQSRAPGSPGQEPCPQRDWHASIWRFDANEPGQTQKEDGHRFSAGIRNSVGVAWDPASKSVYVVQHGRDQLAQLWPEFFDEEYGAENPGEELLRLRDGADFMWPYCYWDVERDAKILAPEYGGDGQKVGDCDQAPRPLAVFPGHWAPNDILFYTGTAFPEKYRGGAFIAFHGSWNRAPLPQQGYNVVFVPMKDGDVTGDWEVFADGFKGREPLERPGDARFRPTGLAQGPDGSLYISDSVTGRIWRVIHEAS